MALKTQLYAGVSALLTGVNALGVPSYQLAKADDIVLNDGNGANQAQKMYASTRTIVASGTDDLDLAGGLTDALGQLIIFATVKAIFVKASTANANNVVIGAAAANQFVGPFGAATHTIAVRPGGRELSIAPATGWTVVAGTGDIFRIANSGAGTSVEYDIVIIGT
jgi:hypothetical protein